MNPDWDQVLREIEVRRPSPAELLERILPFAERFESLIIIADTGDAIRMSQSVDSAADSLAMLEVAKFDMLRAMFQAADEDPT